MIGSHRGREEGRGPWRSPSCVRGGRDRIGLGRVGRSCKPDVEWWAPAVCHQGMTIKLEQPDAGGLGEVVAALREWQDDAAPIQLHPGDLGWLWRFGAIATAAGKVYIEAPPGASVRDLLSAEGWELDEPWTPLQRDLTGPVDDPGVRIEAVGPEHGRRARHAQPRDRHEARPAVTARPPAESTQAPS